MQPRKVEQNQPILMTRLITAMAVSECGQGVCLVELYIVNLERYLPRFHYYEPHDLMKKPVVFLLLMKG